MFQLKSLVFAALIGMIPGIGVAQQAGPPAPVNESNLLVVSEGPTAPMRPAGQPGQVPQPLGAPIATPGITLAELGQIAMDNNPTLAQAAMWVRALQGKQVQVGLYSRSQSNRRNGLTLVARKGVTTLKVLQFLTSQSADTTDRT